jgi:hypothetical protein
MGMACVILVGGPAADGYEVTIPFPFDCLPLYICCGAREPFDHFERVHDDIAYTHLGACRDIPHPQGYPHEHRGR